MSLVHEEIDRRWRLAVPIACVVLVGANLALAVFQERHENYSVWAGALAALVALSPFLADLIVGAIRKPIGDWENLWWFPFPVLAGIAYLLWHPADTDYAPFVLVFMNGELVSRTAKQRGLAIFTGISSIALIVGAQVVGPWTDGAAIWVAGITFGWLGGFLIRELEIRARKLEAAQTELTGKAAAEERSRIAREVHDVIAHSLSVTMLHVTAARMALDRGDRLDEASDWLREAEEQGRKSLAEIRRTVGLLGPQESATAPPMPTVSDIPALVDDFRNAGLNVTLKMEGDVDELPPAAGLNVYRIVQESLTNASKHSPNAPTDVWLNVTEDDIRLRVFNEGTNGHTPAVASPDGGRGLRGMFERAVMMNGQLMAGAETVAGTDGWLVFLSAPRPTS